MHNVTTREGSRFEFGRNWMRFLSLLDEQRICRAQESLCEMLCRTDLEGRTFLDVGSGSGLFSLAARQMGARVFSFDYDPDSVECTREMRQRYFPEDSRWEVQQGSVLDANYLQSLGQFNIVYSWGVLHHTGDMWRALDNVTRCVAPNGDLFVALYNDQGWISKYWANVKRLYNTSYWLRFPIVAFHAPYLIGARFMARALSGRLAESRGMSLRYDMLDWLGGWPFEVASPDRIIDFLAARNFSLQQARTCGRRHGCNQFVFRLTNKKRSGDSIP